MRDVMLLLPEIGAVAAVLAVMLADLWLPKERKGTLSALAIAASVVLLALTFVPPVAQGGHAFGGSFLVDGMALLLKRAFCVTAFLVFLMSREYVAELPRGQGEFYTLGLAALTGMFLCASVNDFMSLFVSLELVTVSFFVLAAFKRDSKLSVEAGLKLLVIGSISAALLLYGIAFVYGATGTVMFGVLASDGSTFENGLRTQAAAGTLVLSPELQLGLFLIFLGLGFKTSAVPLHVWVPDVYQGAPTPVTAYLSVGSKLAGFALMFRLLEVVSRAAPVAAALTPFLALVAALTLFYGNLGAIPQTNIKRLLGYSSIGQCGYVLLGIAAASELGLAWALFYLCAYVVTNLTVFAVIIWVARATKSHDIDDYSGLARTNPLLGTALTVGLLSLAGVPPFIGLVGKFFLVGSAFQKGDTLRWLVYVGLANVVIALYYYLCVVKRIWMRDARTAVAPAVPLRMKVALAAGIVALIVGGIAPQFLDRVTASAAAGAGIVGTTAR